jgi:K+-transporting ATPase A subunit
VRKRRRRKKKTFMSFSFSGTSDHCTWWPMTRVLIILLTISMFIAIFLPSSSCLTSSSDIVQKKLIRSSSSTLPSIRKSNVTILMMFPDIDRFIPNLKSLLIVYEYIVHRYQISKWLNINLQVKDSNCSISLAPHMLVTTMLSTMPDVVFGPFCGNYLSFSTCNYL